LLGQYEPADCDEKIPGIVIINSVIKNFNHNKQSNVVELNYDAHNKSNIL